MKIFIQKQRQPLLVAFLVQKNIRRKKMMYLPSEFKYLTEQELQELSQYLGKVQKELTNQGVSQKVIDNILINIAFHKMNQETFGTRSVPC